MNFLDEGDTSSDRRGVPQEEVEEFFLAHDYHFAGLEAGQENAEDLVSAAPQLVSDAARSIALAALIQYQHDAQHMPLAEISAEIAQNGIDPSVLAQRFDASLPMVLRRLGVLPVDVLGQEAGLVVCDASGSILFRKPVTGFGLPHFGASCPLWPVYTALQRPDMPLRRTVVQQGRSALGFECLAVAWNYIPASFDRDPLYHAVMLILPLREVPEEAQPVGTSCRICPRHTCAARREPSILKEEF